MQPTSFAHDQLHKGHGAVPAASADTLLRERNLRVTVARRAVVEVLVAQHDHLSAEAVAAKVAYRGIHRATVYRTLEALSRAGLLSHRQLHGDPGAYHLASSDHFHAHCTQCETVIALPSHALAEAAEALIRATGFVMDAQQSTMAGRCLPCSEEAIDRGETQR